MIVTREGVNACRVRGIAAAHCHSAATGQTTLERPVSPALKIHPAKKERSAAPTEAAVFRAESAVPEAQARQPTERA
ncbi:MAG: hypothetical protein AAB544_01935 [Patescibacteria group bacterium]